MEAPSRAVVKSNGSGPAIATASALPPGDGIGPRTMEETLSELGSMAARRTGRIPAQFIARRVVAVTEGGDWPLRRAAMEAVLRRCKFGNRDGLVVTRAPAGSVFGSYVTGRTGTPGGAATVRRRGARKSGRDAPPRPYRTALTRLDPLEGSCDCPDYLRGSLGLCKHLLCVLDDVLGRAPLPGSSPPATPSRCATLSWDPVRPLRGAGE